MKIARRPIPPAPDPRQGWLTLDETAGYLRMRRRGIDELRRADPTFAALVILVTNGAPRVQRARLDEWLARRPAGWSSMGGLRPGAFGRPGPTGPSGTERE